MQQNNEEEQKETDPPMQDVAEGGRVSMDGNENDMEINNQMASQLGSQQIQQAGNNTAVEDGNDLNTQTGEDIMQQQQERAESQSQTDNNNVEGNMNDERIEVQKQEVAGSSEALGRTNEGRTVPPERRSTQRKRSRTVEGEERVRPKTDRYGISKTMKELQELVKKMVKAVTRSSSNAREAEEVFTTLSMQVVEMTTEMLNYQEERAALMDQIITLQQNAMKEGEMKGGRQTSTGVSYAQVVQKGLSKAVAAGTCLPPPILPEPTRHVPAEQVILYKAENKGELPTKMEQEAFRKHLGNVVGNEIMTEISAIRATRYGGYTIIFRSEIVRDEAMERIQKAQEERGVDEKQQRIIAPKKKVAKVVCREPPIGYTHVQIMRDFYGRHNPELAQIRNCNRQAKIFETRLGWVIELSTWEAAAVERQGNRIRYGSGYELRVEEFIPLQQCYRCCLFGHSARECSSLYEHCRLCGKQGHSGKDCIAKDDRELWKCANCIWNNQNRGTKLPIDHAAAQLHRCAVAQNEKAIRKSQLATAGVYTVPHKPFIPRKTETTTIPASQASPETQKNISIPSSLQRSNTGGQRARRRTPSLQMARCYAPPTSSGTSSSTATEVQRTSDVVSLRPVMPIGLKIPQPQRRGVSRGSTGRGRGREEGEQRGGGNSSDAANDAHSFTFVGSRRGGNIVAGGNETGNERR